MVYQTRSEQRSNSNGLDGTIVLLSNETAAVEIWPANGFNCYRWTDRLNGQVLDLLYADPQFFAGGKSTRTGIPILFPFPNRIRDARFCFAGQEYRLPVTDASGPNAIHGFACRNPWRVVDCGSAHDSAWVTGEFRGSVDVPAESVHWPADYLLRITYRLLERRLRLEVQVSNPDRLPLPFGLGFHPYFRVPLVAGEQAACVVQAEATAYWELANNLPTGKRMRVAGMRDLTQGQPFETLTLDDVLTDLRPVSEPSALLRRGLIRQAGGPELQLWTSAAFRELVLFTPPHRQAMCLEPYTCTTDALNLQAQGVDAGLLVLEPGQTWEAVVELRLEPG